MKYLLPRSLFGRTLGILLAGLLVSHAIGYWIYASDRGEAVRAIGGFAAAQRIANLTQLVQEVPREWRERLVTTLSDQTFRVALSAQPPRMAADAGDDAASRIVRDFLGSELSERKPQVSVTGFGGPPFGGGHGGGMGRGPMYGFGAFRDLQVAMPLADGQWLTFATALPEGPAFSRQFLVSIAIMAIITLGTTIWAVRQVTRPLSSLAGAAERLGRDVAAPPLPEEGTTETLRASRAFNQMQVRLRNLINTRTGLLAAISHDLRTPLTLLRLRAEGMEDAQEREKMLATIAEMDAMIGATLAFARDESAAEPRKPTDVGALIAGIVDDMSDAGMPVTLVASSSAATSECRPAALKRAFTNLIDNAVKYGKTARVSLAKGRDHIEIAIDDDGPGIPKDDLMRVFEPFYRIEASRSRETGGTGLGLAIAQSIVQAHDGTIVLTNRSDGGLRATVTLPMRMPGNRQPL